MWRWLASDAHLGEHSSKTFLKNSGNTVLDSATYGYSLSGQRLTFANALGTHAQYAYDNISQLKVATSTLDLDNSAFIGYRRSLVFDLLQSIIQGICCIRACAPWIGFPRSSTTLP